FAEGYVPEKCLTEEEIANFEMDISGSNGENYKLKIKKGFIDRVDFRTDGTAEIVDYKTGNIDNVEEKVKGNENCQHIIYPYALEKRGQKVDKFTYVSPAQPDKKVETNILFFESEPSDIIIRALLKNDFLPKDKRNCKYCSYKKYCPKEVIKNEYYR
ncbi:MAG: PD-(D/E)XK nuclease family protein, partial [Firmicutes bacterium]|nr:PD-(D/E)XK nuclease family protein [Bacillota bacterium]